VITMKERIPLQIIGRRLILTSVIECKSLRIPRRIMEFTIDTGSPNSYISDKDVRKLQIPIKDKSTLEEVDFGGSRFKQVSLPRITMYILKENRDYLTLDISLSALKTTKSSEQKMQIAQILPSILGLDFLEDQKISLHVILNENIAYLEVEK